MSKTVFSRLFGVLLFCIAVPVSAQIPERALMVIYEEESNRDAAISQAAASGMQLQAFNASPDVRSSARQQVHAAVAEGFKMDKLASDPGLQVQAAVAAAGADTEMMSIPWFGAEVVQASAAQIAQVRQQLDQTDPVKQKMVRYVEFTRQTYLKPESELMEASLIPATATVSAKWGVGKMRADQVWSRSTGKGVKVAVVDSGIDHQHPFFSETTVLMDGRNNLVRPGQLPVDDRYVPGVGGGHGTHVAGIIAGKGGYGVAPGATLISIKVFDDQGRTLAPNFFISVDRAIAAGADIINMSFAGPRIEQGQDILPLWNAAIARATAQNIVVVAAAGNAPAFRDIGLPGGCPDVITVAATTSTDTIADGSLPGGVSGTFPSKPDVAAPGGNWSRTNQPGFPVEGVPSALAYSQGDIAFAGTSMASPGVAGVCALIREGAPRLSPAQVKASLKRSAVSPSGARSGSGRVDALAAYNDAIGDDDDDDDDDEEDTPPSNFNHDAQITRLKDIRDFWRERNGKSKLETTPAELDRRENRGNEHQNTSLDVLTEILNEQRIFNIESVLEPVIQKRSTLRKEFDKLEEKLEGFDETLAEVAKNLKDAEHEFQSATDAVISAAKVGKIEDVKSTAERLEKAKNDLAEKKKTIAEIEGRREEVDAEMYEKDTEIETASERIDYLQKKLKAAERIRH